MRTILPVLLVGAVAQAQGLPPPDRRVQVSNTVETETRITGQTVLLSVELNSASIEAITAATNKGNCSYTDGNPAATIGTTAANIPASPMESRTAITIWNHSSSPTNALVCSASGTATTTHGLRIESGHQWWKWEGLGGGTTISCRCLAGTCTYGYLEEQCYQ